ncbi:hypothetical protein HOY80DRAFT_1005483 [Tuber brumale]|nr:hypothetical protein HOY80DRAFT_1005483 [Tuber brumale]
MSRPNNLITNREATMVIEECSEHSTAPDIPRECPAEVVGAEPPTRIAIPATLTGTERVSFTECAEILYAVTKYKPYCNSHFEVVPAWIKVLDGLKTDGFCKEWGVQWLRDRVTNLIEFHKEGGFCAIEETPASTIQGKRRRVVRKKYDLTESSVGSLILIERNMDLLASACEFLESDMAKWENEKADVLKKRKAVVMIEETEGQAARKVAMLNMSILILFHPGLKLQLWLQHQVCYLTEIESIGSLLETQSILPPTSSSRHELSAQDLGDVFTSITASRTNTAQDQA